MFSFKQKYKLTKPMKDQPTKRKKGNFTKSDFVNLINSSINQNHLQTKWKLFETTMKKKLEGLKKHESAVLY